MRLLLIHNILEEKGGAETHFLSEIASLRAQGHDVSVFGFCDAPPPESPDEVYACAEPRSWFVRKLLKFTFHPGAYLALRRAVRRSRPDAVHLHMNTKYPLAVLAALRGLPVVQTIHSNGLFCPTGWLVHADDLEVCEGGAGIKCVRHGCIPRSSLPIHVSLHVVWQALAKRVVRAFTPPSRHLYEYLQRFGFENVTRLPYFSPVETPELTPLPPASKQLLYVGVLTRQKGVEYVLAAMPGVLREHPDARLTVIGDGPDSGRLRDIAAQLGIEGQVDFKGRVPNQELAAFYRSARVCVIPSLWLENSPLVAYEAMLAGRPIVGSDRGGIPDLIESSGGGLVFPAKDVDALADSLCKLLGDGELASELGAKGRRYATESLSKQVFFERLMPIIEQALSPEGQRGAPREGAQDTLRS